MKKQGVSSLKSDGTVYWLEYQEIGHYIIPDSVKIVFYGEKLWPTHFDEHGNPQIGGVAYLMLLWELRQKYREGVIKSPYIGEVTYSFEITDEPSVVPAKKRLPAADICPICNEHLAADDHVKTIQTHNYGDSMVHDACAKKFYRSKIIDEICEAVGAVFQKYSVNKENHFAWGTDDNDMWYELISNEETWQHRLSYNPWFMFHTPIGDIKIGWRRRVINITFMENFVRFDMAIFDNEDVNKRFDNEGNRSIDANNVEMMREYLSMVRDIVLLKKTS